MTRKIIRIAIVLLVLLGSSLAGWRAYLSYTINRELVKIRAAGLPVNGEELNRWYASVLDQQNAALVLTQAFALRRNYPDNRSNLIHNLKLPNRGEALTAAQIELLQGYLDLNEARRNKADEALKLPASRYPIDYSFLMNTPLPHLAWVVDIAELHQYAAFVEMASGKVASVASNIVTMLALAHTLDNEPCLISQLVRLKLISMAFTTLGRRTRASPLNAGEISALTRAFARTRTTNVIAHALIGERAMIIPYFRMTSAEYAKINPPKEGEEPKKNSPLPCHGSAILRLIGYYELDYGTFLIGMSKAIAAASNTPPDNLRVNGYFARVGEDSTKRHRTLSGLVFSGYASVTRRENEGIAHQRLALVAPAVESFRNDNGRLPQMLDELRPKYIEELPEDPFTGLNLKYERKEMGYAIYSAGPDREDDGGLERADKKQSEDGKSYDITFIVER